MLTIGKVASEPGVVEEISEIYYGSIQWKQTHDCAAPTSVIFEDRINNDEGEAFVIIIRSELYARRAFRVSCVILYEVVLNEL